MAKIDLKFIAVDDENATIQTFCNSTKEDIVISISTPNGISTICLDIPTAIKFAKTIRTEINKAKEGLSNG